MILRELFEKKMPVGDSVGIIFGRFNPPHKGHKAAWEMAAQNPHWYVGTNQSTQGPKDPLPYDVKIEAMKTVWPNIEGHIMAEQSWLTMASKVFKEYGDVQLNVYTDEDWVTKTIKDYNGKEGPHGYYRFSAVDQIPTPRLSSATALRAAVAADDRAAFSKAAGVDADAMIGDTPFFDLVKNYLTPYAEKEKAKAEKKKKKEPEVAEGKIGKGSAAYKEAEDYLVMMSDALTDREWYDESYVYHELALNLYDLGIGGVMNELKQKAAKGGEWWKDAYDEFSKKFGKFAKDVNAGVAEGIGGMIAGGIGQFVGNKIDPLHGEIMRAHGEMAGRKAEYTIRKYMHLLQKALKQQLDSDKDKGVAEGFFGIDGKTKGAIMNVVDKLSDIPGMWDHAAQTFTPEGLEKLKQVLKDNPKYIKYAVNLTADDYEG